MGCQPHSSRARVHTHTPTNARARAHTHTHTHTCTHTHEHTHALILSQSLNLSHTQHNCTLRAVVWSIPHATSLFLMTHEKQTRAATHTATHTVTHASPETQLSLIFRDSWKIFLYFCFFVCFTSHESHASPETQLCLMRLMRNRVPAKKRWIIRVIAHFHTVIWKYWFSNQPENSCSPETLEEYGLCCSVCCSV